MHPGVSQGSLATVVFLQMGTSDHCTEVGGGLVKAGPGPPWADLAFGEPRNPVSTS